MEMGEMVGGDGWHRERNEHRHRDKPGRLRAGKESKGGSVRQGREGRAG